KEQISLQRINLLNLNGLPLSFDRQIKVQREIIVNLFLINHSHRIKIIRETFTHNQLPELNLQISSFKIAGRLRKFQLQWHKLFGHCWVTDIVQNGYTPTWSSPPPTSVHPISTRSDASSNQ